MSEQIVNAIVKLVENGGSIAIWIIITMQVASILKYIISFTGLYLLIKGIKIAVTSWIKEANTV